MNSKADLLIQGKVDAEVEPDLPQAWIRGDGTVERLFPEFEKAEREYYTESKIFPIMHPIIIKTDILKNDPWVATSLFEAFMASRRACRGSATLAVAAHLKMILFGSMSPLTICCSLQMSIHHFTCSGVTSTIKLGGASVLSTGTGSLV